MFKTKIISLFIFFLVSVSKLFDVFYLPMVFGKTNLPRFDLQIKRSNYELLLSNVPSSIRGVILSDQYKQTVPAELITEGQKYQVKIHLRGERYGHWAFEKKSWRINLKNDKIRGNSELNFIIPEERGYLDEYLAYYMAKKMGLLAPDAWYANLYINGDYQGVYLVIEQLNKDFLSKNNLPENSEIYSEADVSSTDELKPIYDFPDRWKGLIDGKDYEPIKKLIEILKENDEDRFFSEIEKLVDIESFINWQAQAKLMGSYHEGDSINNRLLFNKNANKFYFIPNDVVQQVTKIDINKETNPLAERILKNPKYKEQELEVIKKYAKDYKDFIDYYKAAYREIKKDIYRDSKKRFSNLMFDYGIYKRIKMLQNRSKYFEEILK